MDNVEKQLKENIKPIIENMVYQLVSKKPANPVCMISVN